MLTTLRPPLVPNSTAPASRANSVSSPPRPTLAPGWKWVPRWRTMISPALTTWPPKRFTPRRCAFESRPLRVDDAPFLCAISASPLLDAGDLQARELRAVAHAALVAGLVAVVLDADLRAAQVGHDLCPDLDLGEASGVRRHPGGIDEQHGGQLDRAVVVTGDAVDDESGTDRDLLLPAAGAHDCVHHVGSSLWERLPAVPGRSFGHAHEMR